MRQRRQEDTVLERIATLETEFPHQRRALEELSKSVRELAQRVASLEGNLNTLTSYGKIALLLATAGLIHATGGPIGAFSGRLVRLSVEALFKIL
jgi:uncharacterized coiled-coil protein SlyX